MSNSFTLRQNADWSSAAQALIDGLTVSRTPDDQIEMLESICTGLGDALYPAFLQILQIVEQSGDHSAKATVASTLVNCLISGRLPEGSMAAWGAAGVTGDLAFGQTRRLGPVEYVCAWYVQGGNEPGIDQNQCRSILTSLLNLISTDDKARQLYGQKLRSDAADPLGGSLSSATRQALESLTEHWGDESNVDSAVTAFFNNTKTPSLLDQIAMQASDFLPND